MRQRKPPSVSKLATGSKMLRRKLRVAGSVFAVIAVGSSTAHALTNRSVFTDPDSAILRGVINRISTDSIVRIEGLTLDGRSAPIAVELMMFEVFARNAEIVSYTEKGPVSLPLPDAKYMRGFVDGDPASLIVLTIPSRGAIRGIVTTADGEWTVRGRTRGLLTREVDHRREINSRRFDCAQAPAPANARPKLASSNAVNGAPTDSPATLTARVAVDTDYEFFSLADFDGDPSLATAYVGDLFAYVSAIYQSEIGVGLAVSSLFLRQTVADPFDASTKETALVELQEHWNEHYAATDRTTVHLLSGKNEFAGGTAYLATLCDPETSYGVSGSLTGEYRSNAAGVFWDSFVVAHEIGHNFSSPHTHCYIDIGGVPEPIDKCLGSEPSSGSLSCYKGPSGLPCSLPGKGCGTIMSYCHQRTGGIANISMTFGLHHPYGFEPGRVPVQMSTFLADVASSAPTCFSTSHPAMCGNALVENGEDCDDGDVLFLAGESCSDSCRRTPCGQPTTSTIGPKAGDALYTLKVSVGTGTCDLRVCDVNDSGSVTVADALAILQNAVGIPAVLACPG